MTNSVDPDQTPHSLASDVGLHCLLRPACPNIFRQNVANFHLML